jgi:hypothetical protein
MELVMKVNGAFLANTMKQGYYKVRYVYVVFTSVT